MGPFTEKDHQRDMESSSSWPKKKESRKGVPPEGKAYALREWAVTLFFGRR